MDCYIGLIKGDTRSLDHGSVGSKEAWAQNSCVYDSAILSSVTNKTVLFHLLGGIRILALRNLMCGVRTWNSAVELLRCKGLGIARFTVKRLPFWCLRESGGVEPDNNAYVIRICTPIMVPVFPKP